MIIEAETAKEARSLAASRENVGRFKLIIAGSLLLAARPYYPYTLAGPASGTSVGTYSY